MNERLFQYIWSNLYFDFRRLQTIDGRNLTIVNQGQRNFGDGPDFLEAEIKIDGLSFHGAVELHLKAKEWYEHHHHEDKKYNSVILHVLLFDKDLVNVERADGTQPVTLFLKPYISTKIYTVFQKLQQTDKLPCSGLLDEVPLRIKNQQWDKAHTEYFDYKVDQLARFSSGSKQPVENWKEILSAGLFDGLGINDNRSAMVRLYEILQNNDDWKIRSKNSLINTIWQLSGLDEKKPSSFFHKNEWSFSGSRPSNQPDIRIPQAAGLLYNIQHLPNNIPYHEPFKIWESIIRNDAEVCQPIGKERKNILFATVFLPSIHILGSLLGDNELKTIALKSWRTLKSSIPAKILKKFEYAGLESQIYKNKFGTVYQYKHYCNANRCQDCKLMKYILRT